MEKLTFIALPGWGMNSCIWSPIKEGLKKMAGVIYVNWDDIGNLSDYKSKVMNIIEDNNIYCFSIIGWSLGSLVAIGIADEYPMRVEQLILVGGTSRFTRDKASEYDTGWPRNVIERMKTGLINDREKTLSAFYDSMFSINEKERGYKELFLKLISDNPGRPETKDLLLGLDYLIETDFRDKLKCIKTPTFLIHGEEDGICPKGASEYIARNISGNAELKIFKGAGHIPFFTDCEKFLECIKDFIERGDGND